MFNTAVYRRLWAPLISIALFIPPVMAEPPAGKGKSHKAAVDIDASVSATISAGISIGDARQIATRYELTGVKPLPPGIQKNLARGKPMPPGIAKTRLPDSFIDQLPQHEGYVWQRAGVDLVLVASGTLVISDVLKGVFD